MGYLKKIKKFCTKRIDGKHAEFPLVRFIKCIRNRAAKIMKNIKIIHFFMSINFD